MPRTMKDSGIRWIGEMPQDWETIRIKFLSKLNGRIGWQGLTSEEYCDEGAYLVTGTDFKAGSIEWENCVHVPKERFDQAPEIQLKEGDLLITKDGTVGKVAIAENCPDEVTLNSGVLLIRPKKDSYDNRFLYYVLLSEEFKSWFADINAGNSTILHLYQHDFENFRYALPSIGEQKRIAEYLDSKCSKINSAIEKTQKSIEEYKSLKRSIISRAVTKGLDPNAEMKESCIDYMGDIPVSWSQRRLRFLCSITTGDHDTQDASPDGMYPFYVRSPIVEKCMDYSFEGEGILVAGDGAGAGRVFHHAMGKYAIHQRVYCLHNFDQNEINPSFLHYFLESRFPTEMDKGSAQSTVPSMRLPMLENFIVCFPSLKEQQEIVHFLNSRRVHIDALIGKKEKLIEELTTYRKSLIYEYVTGKKEVI